MGAALFSRFAVARRVFLDADGLLGYKISKYCFEGPAAVLTQTLHAQPALFTCNAAALAVLQDLGIEPGMTAGHSVGEFNALVAGGVMTFSQALDAVRHRAELMAKVRRPGGMLAVGGASAGEIEGILKSIDSNSRPSIAVYNSPYNTVLSGDEAALESFQRVFKGSRGRLSRLKVSHAFHSPLMAEVVSVWRERVASLKLRDPAIPIVLNTTGKPSLDANEIRSAMVDQITAAVRWRQTVEFFASAHIMLLVEVGASSTLARLARQTCPDLRVATLAEPWAAERLAEENL